MLQKFNIIIFLAIAPMLFIPASVGVVAMMAIESEKTLFDQTLNQLEREYTESHVHAMRAKVDSVIDLAAYRKSLIDSELKSRIKRRVDEANKIALSLHDRFSTKPNVTEAEVQELIKAALRPLVWNDGESFIWILDFEGVFYLAPAYLKHLEGQSILNFRDATGRYVIEEEIKLVTEVGEGFLWDTFTRPDEPPEKQFKQLAFVKDFGHYNWYLGSSEYLDVATKNSDKMLLKAISKVDQTNYDQLFIFDTQGTLLLSSDYPQKVGINASILSDDGATDGLFAFKYEWLESISRAGEVKHVYVKQVPNTDWIIGSVLYDADIRSEMLQAQSSLIQQYETRIQNMKSISIWSFVLAIIVSLTLSISVHYRLVGYREKLAQKNKALVEFNSTLEESVSKRTCELELANEQLELMAKTDSLTGAQNRYAFMDAIESEVKRSNRYQKQFSLIMFDLDFFKAVNDQFGHDVGDDVLIKLVNLVKACLRDVDVFCRFGGEEFIVLIPNTDLDSAEEVAERLRATIENYRFDHVNQLTISLGVVEHVQKEPVDSVIKRVDLALYQSKDSGRNKVSVLRS